MKKYYHAYDERYKDVHSQGLLWETRERNEIVLDEIKKHEISLNEPILEIGCGEGRDSIFLLKEGYNVVGTDCSMEAILTCKKIAKENNLPQNFKIVDIITDTLNQKYKFIYSICVLHMFCENKDRDKFWTFVKNHLDINATCLVCVMGDGEREFKTLGEDAFEKVRKLHQQTNKELIVTKTSCQIVSWENLEKEITNNGLIIENKYITEKVKGFSKCMAVLVKTK